MPTLFKPGLPRPLEFEDVIRGQKSPEYVFAPGASRVRRIVDVRWADRVLALRAFLGYPEYAPGATPALSYVRRVLPDSMADFYNAHGGPYLWATQVERVEGIGPTGAYDADGIPEYEYARMSVIYEATTYGVYEDRDPRVLGGGGVPDESKCYRYVTIGIKPSAEFVTLPRGYYFWVDEGDGIDNSKIDFASTKLLPSMEVHFIWRQVPRIPTAARTHIGCVNESLYRINSNGDADDDHALEFPAGTLLMLGVDLNRYKLATGHSVFDITYRMKYYNPENNGRGHNYFYRYNKSIDPKRLIFRRVNSDAAGTGDNVFQSKDFTLLFRPA